MVETATIAGGDNAKPAMEGTDVAVIGDAVASGSLLGFARHLAMRNFLDFVFSRRKHLVGRRRQQVLGTLAA